MNFADPSGYCFMGCFRQKPFKALGGLLRRVPILGTVITIAAGAICGPVCAVLASMAVTGLASGNLGMALKAGLITAVTAGAFAAVGDLTGGLPGAPYGGHAALDFMSPAHVFNMAGHAAVGCLSAMASCGKCGPGALSGAAGSFATPLTTGLSFTEGLLAHSLVGGLASVAGGGKFGNGAMTAAFGYLFNFMARSMSEPQKGDTLAGGTGLPAAPAATAGVKAVYDWLVGTNADEDNGFVYHRLNDTPDDVAKIYASGELWGAPTRNYYVSDIPKVKAYWGPLSSGERGFEFTTVVPPDSPPVPAGNGNFLGFPTWSGPRPGVSVEGGFAKIPIVPGKLQGY